jgi:AmmeMemoRadiSam system protein B
VSDGPSRIILPGGGKPGALVGPDGRPLSSTPPEDVPESERLPTHPRLRPVEIQEAREGGRTLLVLVDPTGIAPQALAIAAEAMPVLMLLDGSVALDDLIDLIVRETGDARSGESVRMLVKELDQRLFLESPRYEAAKSAARAAYRAEPTRPAALAGLSYPEDPKELDAFLTAHEETARSWKSGAALAPGLTSPAPPAGGEVVALAAPHIDLRRGGAVIARAFIEFEEVPDVVFVFGTGHSMLEEPFAVTVKPFETPLGTVETDAQVVVALEQACGPSLTAEEMAHRDEHSVEFQAVELKRRFGERPFKIVPLLCGGFHGLVRYERRPAEEPKIETLASALIAEVLRLRGEGKRVAFVAGIDLAHVGARFGDALDLDEAALKDIETKDRAAIAAALTGDAEAWFDAIAAHGDSTRICGFAPMYMMLRAARPGAGRLLAYEQSLEPAPVESAGGPEGASVVTYASIAYP